MVPGAHGFPIKGAAFFRGHDAEIGKQQLAHVFVYLGGLRLTAQSQKSAHKMLVKRFLIGLQSDGAAAQCNQFLITLAFIQQRNGLQNGPNIEIVIICADGNNPGF